MRVAVVGHVEWVRFARVERVPAPGEIAVASDTFALAAGGGAVAAVQLARLAGEAEMFTALGDDEPGLRAADELERRGVRVHAARRRAPQRRAFTFLDDTSERTITVMGRRLVPSGDDDLPWDDLRDVDAVYFTGGDAGAIRAARQARVLVATPRAEEGEWPGGVALDALVLSGQDDAERAWAAELDRPPLTTVTTLGAQGGRYESTSGAAGSFAPAPLPGPRVDAYGAGDSFAGGLTYGLGAGAAIDEALALAARCGAACLAGRGPYEGQLGGGGGRYSLSSGSNSSASELMQ